MWWYTLLAVSPNRWASCVAVSSPTCSSSIRIFPRVGSAIAVAYWRSCSATVVIPGENAPTAASPGGRGPADCTSSVQSAHTETRRPRSPNSSRVPVRGKGGSQRNFPIDTGLPQCHCGTYTWPYYLADPLDPISVTSPTVPLVTTAYAVSHDFERLVNPIHSGSGCVVKGVPDEPATNHVDASLLSDRPVVPPVPGRCFRNPRR